MTASHSLFRWLGSVLFLAAFMLVDGVCAAERDKLLSDAGVSATFATFRIDPDWWKLDKNAQAAAAAAMKDVVQKHNETIAIDVYLMRGLSEHADLLFRLHAADMIQNQNFLVDLMATPLGKHLMNVSTFNGLTKKLNYVPAFSDEIKSALKTPAESGAKLYAIVIPIRKDATWWMLDQEARNRMMREHTEASLPYLKTVKRKLYHSSGLDDFDFITYFETSNVADFHNLVLNLERIKENQHNRRFGNPTLLGTIRPLDEILEILTR